MKRIHDSPNHCLHRKRIVILHAPSGELAKPYESSEAASAESNLE